LANTYLLLADPVSAMSLENKLAVINPGLIRNNVMLFGIARILKKDLSGAAALFGSYKDGAASGVRQWVHLYYGFTLMLDRSFGPAADVFVTLSKSCQNALVAGLSAFFLADTLNWNLILRRTVLLAAALEGQERVLKILPQINDWNHKIDTVSAEMYIAVLVKYLDKAGQWLYGKDKRSGS
jgi:hypothetical protein